MEERLKLGNKMREIPLNEENRLKLASEMETIQSAWNKMQNVYSQWVEGAILHRELANALVHIAVELHESLPETDELGNPK